MIKQIKFILLNLFALTLSALPLFAGDKPPLSLAEQCSIAIGDLGKAGDPRIAAILEMMHQRILALENTAAPSVTESEAVPLAEPAAAIAATPEVLRFRLKLQEYDTLSESGVTAPITCRDHTGAQGRLEALAKHTGRTMGSLVSAALLLATELVQNSTSENADLYTLLTQDRPQMSKGYYERGFRIPGAMEASAKGASRSLLGPRNFNEFIARSIHMIADIYGIPAALPEDLR